MTEKHAFESVRVISVTIPDHPYEPGRLILADGRDIRIPPKGTNPNEPKLRPLLPVGGKARIRVVDRTLAAAGDPFLRASATDLAILRALGHDSDAAVAGFLATTQWTPPGVIRTVQDIPAAFHISTGSRVTAMVEVGDGGTIYGQGVLRLGTQLAQTLVTTLPGTQLREVVSIAALDGMDLPILSAVNTPNAFAPASGYTDLILVGDDDWPEIT